MYYLFMKSYTTSDRWSLWPHKSFSDASEIILRAVKHYKATPGGESLYGFKHYPAGEVPPLWLNLGSDESGLHIIERPK